MLRDQVSSRLIPVLAMPSCSALHTSQVEYEGDDLVHGSPKAAAKGQALPNLTVVYVSICMQTCIIHIILRVDRRIIRKCRRMLHFGPFSQVYKPAVHPCGVCNALVSSSYNSYSRNSVAQILSMIPQFK